MATLVEAVAGMACENCREARNQFVHDTKSDTLICTICGAVVRGFMVDRLRRPAALRPAPCDAAPQADRAGALVMQPQPSSSAPDRLLDRVFRGEVKARRMHARLQKLITLTGSNARVHRRAAALVQRDPKFFQCRRNRVTIAAAIAVARRSVGCPANLKDLERAADVKRLSFHVSRLCRHFGISQRASSAVDIPLARTMLALDFSDEKRLRALFAENTRLNGSVGHATVLALTLFRYLGGDRARLDDVARVTCTSRVTLLAYIDERRAFRFAGARVGADRSSPAP